ncbi:MAG: HD domain-containing protein [Deltaproteobacteria bacterium]|nr:HD domain-containing protein [Deltaproteobacteria bacterium]
MNMLPERHTPLGISGELVDDLKDWFAGYVRTFKEGDIDYRNIVLKEEHTKRVCEEIVGIGSRLGLRDNELRLAEIIALFHDVGRFEQYARYKTFADWQSENHAELGVTVLQRFGVLNQCEESTRDLIVRTIRYHNRAALPPEETEPCLFFAKLLRDADKLDIWRVVTDYYRRQDGMRNGTLELDLPDTPEFSDAVYQDVVNRKIVDINHVKTLNDFKLLQIGWVFDVNFGPTLRAVRSRRYLEMIRDALPKSERMDALFAGVYEYLEERLRTVENGT